MSKYNDISINELVKWINHTYFLPDIQRPFVWWNDKAKFEEKVCSLFDSILRDYPIWTFLFWEVNKERINEDKLNLLQFLNISNKDKNEEFNNISSEKDYILVLDGQQRMTIFNLVFNWTFEDVYRGKTRKRNLYFNVSKNIDDLEQENDNLYEFKFFEENNWEYFENNNQIWYKMKDAIKLWKLSIKRKEIREKFNIQSEWEEILEVNLETLRDSIVNNNLSYYEIDKSKKDDEALEIFVRVNSKWTVLSYSDLLFSKITQFWKNQNTDENARDIFFYFLKGDNTNWEKKWINRYWDGFKFTNDFILKTSLVLIDSEIRYKLKNFDKKNINLIKENWYNITSSIKNVIEFLTKIWITSHKLLRSNNAIIPLIYYIYKNNLSNKSIELNSLNRDLMEKYIYTILINWVFWWQTDQLLTDTRDVIKNNLSTEFPLSIIIAKLWEKRNIKKGADIKILLDDIKYNTDKSKIILSILYGNEMDKEYQEDHLFPQAKTKKNINLNLVNNIWNIQILKNENQTKNDTDFKIYRENIITKVPLYDEINFIPQIDNELQDYTEQYFEYFIEKRKILILEKVKKYFVF